MKQYKKHLVCLLKAYPNIQKSEISVWAAKHGYDARKIDEGLYKLKRKN